MLLIALIALISSSLLAGETNCFLWKVESESNTVYLLGSVHAGTPDMYPLPTAMEDAYAEAKVVAVEADISKLGVGGTLKLLLRGAYQDGTRLKDHVSEETYNLLTEEVESIGLTPTHFERTKPWFVAFTLEALDMQKTGLIGDLGIDMYFLLRAAGAKQIKELESVEQQLDMLDDKMGPFQELFLKYSLQERKNAPDLMKKIMKSWKSGNADEMDKLLTSEFEKTPELQPVYDIMFTDRNVAMSAKIEKYLIEERVHLVIVGAGHMVGESGIVSLLEKTGKYTVTQQ